MNMDTESFKVGLLWPVWIGVSLDNLAASAKTSVRLTYCKTYYFSKHNVSRYILS